MYGFISLLNTCYTISASFILILDCLQLIIKEFEHFLKRTGIYNFKELLLPILLEKCILFIINIYQSECINILIAYGEFLDVQESLLVVPAHFI